jgi:hypothetical protein
VSRNSEASRFEEQRRLLREEEEEEEEENHRRKLLKLISSRQNIEGFRGVRNIQAEVLDSERR